MTEITEIDVPDASLVEWSGFLGETAVVALAEGGVILHGKDQRIVDAHDGLLCARISSDEKTLICGGEDGRVTTIDPTGTVERIAEIGGKWIDQIATGPSGAIAYASGKQAWISRDGLEPVNLTCERSIEGLAFAPRGMRIAIARFNGVELHWANSNSPSQILEWNGAHSGVMFSPDGKSVVSTLQENALHGWRLSDQRHMQMTGYPTRVKSMSWSKKGKWLATSGAPAAIVWPFSGKDGPMGKSPLELASMGQTLVTQVSCHHQEDVIAVGYENGMIMLVKIEDGQMIPLRKEGRGEITTLNWHHAGNLLAFGTAEGEAGIINVSG